MKKTVKTKKSRTIRDYFTPNGSIICQDVMHEKNENFSFLRILDALTGVLPGRFMMWYVAELAYNVDIPDAQYQEAQIKFDLSLTNPKGETFTLMSDIPALASPDDANKTVQRLLFDLTGQISFQSEGVYMFKLHGRAGNDDPELLLSRSIRIRKLDLKQPKTPK